MDGVIVATIVHTKLGGVSRSFPAQQCCHWLTNVLVWFMVISVALLYVYKTDFLGKLSLGSIWVHSFIFWTLALIPLFKYISKSLYKLHKISIYVEHVHKLMALSCSLEAQINGE
ncbi:hypothetical protein IFM89_024852 [Coptis chinensis]|uniref:Uncharacterized protein n=1 Tax=Coptis chinensis TaxID=261450 RepID=A0A835HMG7_9MAGN|nr:hypothetical protein IFM89_024852 [Coptis chinensis]